MISGMNHQRILALAQNVARLSDFGGLTRRVRLRRFAPIVIVAALTSAAAAQSVVAPSNYDYYEARRREAIGLQLGTQEWLRARSGLPSRLYPGARPYSLESIYAGLATPWGTTDVFEPWPLVPGDIYGRQFDFGTPTPLGHVTTYTSPNSYTYEPYYAAPLQPKPLVTAPVRPPLSPWPEPGASGPVGPPAVVVPRPSSPYSAPPEELPPPTSNGLREF